MSSYPALDELLWLFEVDEMVEYEDLGWPQSRASWETTRGEWRVLVTIDVYAMDLQITAWHNGAEVFDIWLKRIVEQVSVDRTHGSEALVATLTDSSGIKPVRLTLKPTVRIDLESRLDWYGR